MAETRDLKLLLTVKDEMSKQLNAVSGGLGFLKKAVAVVGIGALGKQMIDSASDMEQLNIAFTTLLGSADKAGEFTKGLQDMASRTPMETSDLAQASQTLLAFGMSADDVMPSLQMIGDVSLGNSQKFASLSLAFAQVQSTGRLMGQDLLQMVNQGFNPLQIMSEKTGLSMAELKDKMAEGAISADAVAEAFKVATSEGGRFHGGMEAQSKSLAGMISTLKDNFTLFLAEAGKPFVEILKVIVTWLGNTIGKMMEFYKNNKEVINTVVSIVGAFTLAYVGITKVVQAFGLLKTATNLVGIAMKSLMANPIILFLALATAGVVYLSNKFGGLKNAFLVIGSAFAILGNLVVIGLKELGNQVIKFVNKALDVGNKIYNFFSGLLEKVGVDIGKADMSIDFQFDADKNWSNVNSMLDMMDSMKVQAETKKAEQNEAMAGMYQADLDKFNFTEGEKAKAGKDASEKLEASYEKLGEKFKSVMEENKKAMEETGKKIIEIAQKIEDLKVGYAKDTLSNKQSVAELYVAQEQKVAELSAQWQTESDQTKKDSLLAEYELQKSLLDQRKTIELAYQNEVNEARRRASLSDFERQLEDLSLARTNIELEFQAKYESLQKELKIEEEKYKVLSELQAWGLKEADRFLAQGEKQTVDSVNRQIAYYNKLAQAVKNAQAGNYTSYASLASGTTQRANASNTAPSVNITVNGDVSGQDLVNKVSEAIMGNLRNNTQLAF